MRAEDVEVLGNLGPQIRLHELDEMNTGLKGLFDSLSSGEVHELFEAVESGGGGVVITMDTMGTLMLMAEVKLKELFHEMLKEGGK